MNSNPKNNKIPRHTNPDIFKVKKQNVIWLKTSDQGYIEIKAIVTA